MNNPDKKKKNKKKDNLIQTKLTFTQTGELNIIKVIENVTNENDKQKVKKNQNQKQNQKQKQKILPLPETYKPPEDLNQYCAPLPEIDKSFSIHNKLPYLQELLNILITRAGKNTNLIDKINEHYKILETHDAKLLISLFQRPIPNIEQYYKRLATEFRLIKKKQFTKVFIQVLEILTIANNKGIPHIIRGSAGSSLICYLLKITDIDPIKEIISLARFMHNQRDDLPDIDMDFPSNRRDEIYEEIFKKYGNKVARISNHVKYSQKTAIKQAIRETGYNHFIPKEYDITTIIKDSNGNTDMNKIIKINTRAEQLEGEFKHFSLHCGGIIIFDKPIPAEYILETHEKGNSRMPNVSWQQVNLNKDQVDDYMFIKIDILSNRGLTELWDIDTRNIETYPTDIKVFNFLSNGNNIGIVYGESRAMRKALICIKPRNIQDIALALAIIRPVARDVKTAYFKDYNDYKMILEDLEKAKKNTTGIDTNKPINDSLHIGDYIIYDDDAIQYIQRLLKCNEAEADIYRKAFSKNKWGKMREFETQLRQKHPNFTNDKIQLIYNQLCNLQSYSFCKSHAISYAKLVYALAYCRVYKPIEFWISALNNCNSSYRKWVYYREAVAVGIKLTRGYSPWKWNDAGKCIVSCSNRKIPIDNNDESVTLDLPGINKLEYFRLGYWCHETFIGGCYLSQDTEITIKSKHVINPTTGEKTIIKEEIKYWRFRGLISNYRCCKQTNTISNLTSNTTSNTKSNKYITFCTIGYDNGKYIDLVMYGKIGLSKIHLLEGYGIMQDETNASWIKVVKWNSVFV